MNHPGLCVRENVTASCLLCNYLDQIAALRARCEELERRLADSRSLQEGTADLLGEAYSERDALRAEVEERDRERGLAGAWEARAKNAEAEVEKLKERAEKAEGERDLEGATFQKFRDDAYAREAEAGLIRTKIESDRDRLRETAKEVLESLPPTYVPADNISTRYARALRALAAALGEPKGGV